MQQDRPRKLQRISQACDLCHRRSIRCRPSNEDNDRCQNCYDFDVACTYERPSKRKKHPQAPAAPAQLSQPSARSSLPRNALTSDAVPASAVASNSANSTRNDSLSKANDFPLAPALANPRDPAELDLPWRVFALSSESIILDLFDAYMEIVYPLYPFFNEASDKAKIKSRQHLTDKGMYTHMAFLLLF